MSTVTTNDNSIKYGWRYGGNQGISVPATSADYLNRMGSCFVTVEDGVARTCASNDTTVDGWLMMGKETTHGQAIALTGGDYFVINDPTAVFECPVDETIASLAVTAIGEGAFIGAGSLVPPGKKIPPNTLALGRPAKVIRTLTEEDLKDMQRIRTEYVEKGQYYKSIKKSDSSL